MSCKGEKCHFRIIALNIINNENGCNKKLTRIQLYFVLTKHALKIKFRWPVILCHNRISLRVMGSEQATRKPMSHVHGYVVISIDIECHVIIIGSHPLFASYVIWIKALTRCYLHNHLSSYTRRS